MKRITHLVLLLVAGGLSACNSGTDAPPKETPTASPAPPANQPSPWTYKACESSGDSNAADTHAAVDGIWQGTLTNELSKATEPWTAIVSADGRFHLRSTGHTLMSGTLDVDGNGYTGEGIAISGSGQWRDGTPVSAVTVAGAIAERERLNGDFVQASGDAGCFDFAYDADAYERPSSLDLVGGRWIIPDYWNSRTTFMELDVSAQGEIAGNDTYGCNHAGSIALLDERFNLYALTLVITQRAEESYPCWGPGSFEGFAYLEDSSDGSSVNHYLHLAFANEETTRKYTLNR